MNLSMSTVATITAFIADFSEVRKISPFVFWKASLTAALASPISYASLRYITYPMMILTKSSKPVPVMLIGVLFYKRVYPWFKYASVLLLCCGIALFTAAKSAAATPTDGSIVEQPWFYQLLGVAMVFLNLCLDGYTNNEQDHIFAAHAATPLQMMKFTNAWQALYLLVFLLVDRVAKGERSGLSSAWAVAYWCPAIRRDILMFCLCASVGQVLICGLIREFGSLSWITLSVTRQLFTVLLSVFIFRHSVNAPQWVGIALVFAGLGLEITMVYLSKKTHLSSASTSSSSSGSVGDRARAESGGTESEWDPEASGSEKRKKRE